MVIMGFLGSPRKNGNTSTLLQRFGEAATKKGHSFTLHQLYDDKIKPCVACQACQSGKVEICVHNDNFNIIAKAMEKTDLFVLASPVYMGQITGPTKNFLDRWVTFVKHDFSIRRIAGKKFATITTCGAPAEAFASVTDYLKHWLGDFFKLQHVGSIQGGNLMGPGDVAKQPDLLKQVDELAFRL